MNNTQVPLFSADTRLAPQQTSMPVITFSCTLRHQIRRRAAIRKLAPVGLSAPPAAFNAYLAVHAFLPPSSGASSEATVTLLLPSATAVTFLCTSCDRLRQPLVTFAASEAGVSACPNPYGVDACRRVATFTRPSDGPDARRLLDEVRRGLLDN